MQATGQTRGHEMTISTTTGKSSSSRQRSVALDFTRLAALLLVFHVHVSEMAGDFGGFAAFNPSSDESWGTLGSRIDQWRPGHEGASAFATAFRWTSCLGDHAVGVFLLVSGIALSWSAARRDGLARRSTRWLSDHLWAIGAAWVIAHGGLALLAWAIERPIVSLGWWQFWASLVGVRFTPTTIYYGLPAWWYVGMLLQVYLVFGLLLRAFNRWGTRRLLIVALPALVLLRGAGLLLLDDQWRDVWSRGGFAVTRLPELLVGMAIGLAMAQSAEAPDGWLRRVLSPVRLCLAGLAWLLGWVASFTLPGMALAPLLTTLGLALPLLAVGARLRPRAWLSWCSSRSYDFYLVHHLPVIALCAAPAAPSILARALVALFASLLGAEILHRCAAWLLARRSRLTSPRRLAVLASALAGCLALTSVAEAHSQRTSPRENLGWGERASMTPDRAWGWKLHPSSQTHLRWLGYDYTVTADELGLPRADSSGTGARVLVLGDAFSSAEGVDTNRSWVAQLGEKSQGKLQVLRNASVTGWGPDQEARAAEDLIPKERPEVVVVETFINDLADIQLDDADFQDAIGFRNPDPTRFPGLLAAANLRQTLPGPTELKSALGRGSLDPHGYGFLQLMPREADPDLDLAARAAGERFARIKRAADSVGARVVVVLVPSGVQVCRAADLPYLSTRLDLANYDLERPQRLLTTAWRDAGATDLLDLRPELRTGTCPYVPYNMHWSQAGHDRVAAAVAQHLTR